MPQTLDLKGIIARSKHDKKVIAAQLFPHAKYPDMALARVLKGAGQLDADQISKLAHMHGTTASALFEGYSWQSKSSNGVTTFQLGQYTAELDTSVDPWVSRLHDNGSLFHETVLHSRNVPVSELLAGYNELITAHEASKK